MCRSYDYACSGKGQTLSHKRLARLNGTSKAEVTTHIECLPTGIALPGLLVAGRILLNLGLALLPFAGTRAHSTTTDTV